jgi:hypothetical protein
VKTGSTFAQISCIYYKLLIPKFHLPNS